MSKSVPPVFGLNRMLWAAIVQSGLIPDTQPYQGLVPIIPTQEEPQLISVMDAQDGIGSYPYIVYSWHTNSIDPVSWYKTTDMVTYRVYAVDMALLRKLVLLIVDLFKRYDDSAAVVNQYIAQAYPDPESEYRAYNYNYISVVSADPGAPQTSENDPSRATISLRVNYSDTRNDAALQTPTVWVPPKP